MNLTPWKKLIYTTWEISVYKLNDTGLTPPCGWIYSIPETKVEIEADSYDHLLKLVGENYRVNKIEIPRDIEYLIQDYICHRCPTGFCGKFVNRFAFTARTLLNGTTALAIMIRQGKGSFVSHDKAEGRALVCSNCPMNAENPGCYACKGFEAVVKGVRRDRRTSLDHKLKVCGICGCFIKALVHVDVNILRATTLTKQIKQYPDFCWKRKELETQTQEQ